MIFDWTVKFGDILTSVTIIVSVSALVYSWSQDRATRETANADRIRDIAAVAVTQLDRWQLLNKSLYQELQPIFVETSELLLEEFDVAKARDYMWKKTNEKRTQIQAKILDEKIFTYYIKLMPYFPEIREQYASTLEQLQALEESTSEQFLGLMERDVLSFADDEESYQSPDLGNALRATAGKHEERLSSQFDQITGPVRSHLLRIVTMANDAILRAGR